jgi:hypothetical protein
MEIQTYAKELGNSELLNCKFHEANNPVNLRGTRKSNFKPVRIPGSVWVNPRISRMFQPLTYDHALHETDIHLIIVVEVSKFFATEKEGTESVLSSRPRALFDAELLESLN